MTGIVNVTGARSGVIGTTVGTSGSTSASDLDSGTLAVARMAGKTVVHTQIFELAGDGSNDTNTDWEPSGLTITVLSANAALGSSIFIAYSTLIGIAESSSRRIDIRIQRTAPSASTIQGFRYLGMDGPGVVELSLKAGSCMDASLGSGDHTYRLEFRTANATASEAGAIYYKWHTNSIHTITAMVIK